jgi:hypothetical protein
MRCIGDVLGEDATHPPAMPGSFPPPPPLLHCVCLGGWAGRGVAGRGWVADDAADGCLPTPPHLLYSTTPPSAVPACRVGVGGAARRGWEADDVQVFVSG